VSNDQGTAALRLNDRRRQGREAEGAGHGDRGERDQKPSHAI
jgi:hypothetical protein